MKILLLLGFTLTLSTQTFACEFPQTYYMGSAYFSPDMELLLTDFSGAQLRCAGDDYPRGGQHQFQQGGPSLCGKDLIMKTMGAHFSDGRIAGELMYECLSWEEYENEMN